LPGAKGAALQINELVEEETMSVDEMIACLGSCRARWEIAAMIEALSLHPGAKQRGCGGLETIKPCSGSALR